MCHSMNADLLSSGLPAFHLSAVICKGLFNCDRQQTHKAPELNTVCIKDRRNATLRKKAMQPGLFQTTTKILSLKECLWEKLGCSENKGFVYLTIVFLCYNLFFMKPQFDPI